MERTYLEPAGIAPPPEPYSHAIRCGDTLYIVTGQRPVRGLLRQRPCGMIAST